MQYQLIIEFYIPLPHCVNLIKPTRTSIRRTATLLDVSLIGRYNLGMRLFIRLKH